jgi:ribonuclease P protein component
MPLPARSQLGRIQRAADFERLLGTPSRARSNLFAVNHLRSEPSRAVPPGHSLSTGLSTDMPTHAKPAVDQSAQPAPEAELQGHWLGLVVPKRMAKRAVTRNLVRRLVRATLMEQLQAAAPLPPGLWSVRLRAPIDKKQFPSASSDALRAHLRADLALLWRRALNPRPAKTP